MAACDIRIKKIHKWETSDGVEHSSHEMAVQHILNQEVCELFEVDFSKSSQDVVNVIGSNRRKIREYLDACDAMEKAAQ